MLQDMITAADNEAMRDLDKKTEAIMGQATGGLNLGGLGF